MKLSKQMRKAGWTFFGLMWLPFITLFVGMIGMPTGEYEWSELPLLSRGSMIAVFFFMILSTLLLVGAPIVAGITNQLILRQGRAAEARILKVWKTGTTINDDPVVRFLLEVQPPDAPAFQAEAERLVSLLQLPQIQPGTLVSVKYDAINHTVALMNAEDSMPFIG